MKVGILTYHCAHNYGAILQCIALQNYLKRIGTDATVIDYEPEFLTKPYRVFQRYRFSFRKPFLLPYELYREIRYAVPRWFCFEKSIQRNLVLSTGRHDIVDDSFDAYIIGSDQIWNLGISHGDLNYFANFPFPKGTKKYIAYAASMELRALSPEKADICRKHIPNFDEIGVRETNLVNLIAPFTNVTIQQVVDPVFLLSREDWRLFALKPKVKTNYVLLYQVRENSASRVFAQKVAKRRNAVLVEICAWVKRTKIGKYDIQTASPEEFVGLIECADCIVTSSFHGTAFSILFEKDFYALRLNDGADSRIELLLEQFNVPGRLFDVSSEPTDLGIIDHTSVNNSITLQVESSRAFLENALK